MPVVRTHTETNCIVTVNGSTTDAAMSDELSTRSGIDWIQHHQAAPYKSNRLNLLHSRKDMAKTAKMVIVFCASLIVPEDFLMMCNCNCVM